MIIISAFKRRFKWNMPNSHEESSFWQTKFVITAPPWRDAAGVKCRARRLTSALGGVAAHPQMPD